MYKQAEKYFSKHVMYNSFVHLVIGIGLGILLTYPVVGIHPLRWGIGLVVVGLFAHVYPVLGKK